jgi:hypothetical protein
MSGTTRLATLASVFAKCNTVRIKDNDNSDDVISTTDIALEPLLIACQCFADHMQAVGQSGNARDLRQNIHKIQTARTHAPVDCRNSVRALLQYEQSQGVRSSNGGGNMKLKDPSAAMGLLWARRAVAFQHHFNRLLMYSIRNSTHHSTVDMALQAYAAEIQPFHSWALQQIFTVAFYTTTPDRDRALVELWGSTSGEMVPPLQLQEAQQVIVLQQIQDLGEIWESVRILTRLY